MQVKLSSENCSAKLVVPALAKGYIPAKIIVDPTETNWTLDMHIQPKVQTMILGTYIVNDKGKQVRAKGCVAYQGMLDEKPLIIVKTLGVGHQRHLIFLACKVNGTEIMRNHR